MLSGCSTALMIGVYSVLSGGEFSFSMVLVAFTFTFGVAYFTGRYAVRVFLINRIRTIHRVIRNYKLGDESDTSIDMDKNEIKNVNQEVIDWAQTSNEELKALKEQETFRREFIGNLAHELKTPVFSIQGYILTLLEGGMDDPSVNTKFLERASKGVDRMTRIIEDLDVITKVESGKIPLKIDKLDLVDLTGEVMSDLQFKAKEKTISLKFNKSYVNPIMVFADRDRIAQVLINLISNAISYCESEGSIELRFFDMGENVLVEVSDDGPGIEEQHLNRLFERFYRIDKSRSRNVGGSGLGLSIVKHFIEAHNQTINVRSTVGKGSTFSFTLKRA